MPRVGLDSASVVTAAAALADRDGLQELSLARLAGELGVRSPSLYAHVDGLEDLRRRVAVRGAQELAVVLQSAAAGVAGTDALAAVAVAYRGFAREHPGMYAALQPARDPDDSFEALVDVMVAVLRGYGLDGDDALHGVRIVRAALHGFVTLELDGGFGLPLDLDVTFDRLVASLDRGLGSTS